VNYDDNTIAGREKETNFFFLIGKKKERKKETNKEDGSVCQVWHWHVTILKIKDHVLTGNTEEYGNQVIGVVCPTIHV